MKLFKDIPEKKYQQESFEELVEKMSSYSGTLTQLARFIMKLEWEKTKRSFVARKYYMAFGSGKRILNEALNLNAK